MKYLQKISLIPLAALMVAACSGPTAIQSSTETDDMYYASTDKTVFASKPAATTEDQVVESNTNSNAAVNSDEVANPEYSARSNNNNGSTYSDYDYYSEDYTYASRIRRFNSPYRGMSYYDFAYTDPYWYGSSFYAYDPFYSPGFYRPGFYTGLSLNIGWGNFGWGNPFYSPFYGYGGGFFNPYGGYYSGYRNGFYNGFYNGYYANGGNYDRSPTNYRPRTYGPRGERSVVPVNGNTAGGTRVPGNAGGRPSRITDLGGAAAPGGNIGGVRTPDNAGTVQPQTRPGRGSRVVTTPDAGNTSGSGIIQPADNNVYRPSSRPVRRSVETITTNEPAPTPPSFPADIQRTRPGRSQRVIEAQPSNSQSPRFETPRREQRVPEVYRPAPAPQRNDSWSQPSQPSRSTSSPSNSGGSNSGGGRPRSRN